MQNASAPTGGNKEREISFQFSLRREIGFPYGFFYSVISTSTVRRARKHDVFSGNYWLDGRGLEKRTRTFPEGRFQFKLDFSRSSTRRAKHMHVAVWRGLSDKDVSCQITTARTKNKTRNIIYGRVGHYSTVCRCCRFFPFSFLS